MMYLNPCHPSDIVEIVLVSGSCKILGGGEQAQKTIVRLSDWDYLDPESFYLHF